MARTTSSSRSPYEPFPRNVVRSREEMLEEATRPCGGFTSPDGTEERLAAFVAERMRRIDPLGDGQLFAGSGVPLNWQRLLRYLHEEGVVGSPHFRNLPIANDRPKVFNFGLTMNHTARKTDGRGQTTSGFGASMTAEDAMSKAVGETLERYFLSLYRNESLHQASFESLQKSGQRALPLTELNGFLPFQKKTSPELAGDDATPLRWVRGEEYPSGKKILLPAQLVFWNYHHNSGERVLVRSTTSGCAGQFSKDEAVLAGLLELIQRDGFLIHWLNRIAPPVLDVSLLNNPEINAFIEYAKRYRITLTFLNTTSDIAVPSVTCVALDQASTDGPIISLGAATGFDIKDIVMHSALEALVVNGYAASLPTYGLSDDYVPFSDRMLGRDARLSAWKGPRMAERFSFFVSGKKQNPMDCMALAAGTETTPERLTHVLHEFEKLGAGYEVYVYEVHDNVLDSLGYTVVRTIVPQLMPLYLAEYTAPLDSKRLREVPAKLGYEIGAEMNPWPHPFP